MGLKEIVEQWLNKMGLEEWGEVQAHPGHHKKFITGLKCAGQRANGPHEAPITIFLGLDDKLYIKGDGDWDYQWELDSKDKNCYPYLKFLLTGTP